MHFLILKMNLINKSNMMCEKTHSLQSGEKSWNIIIPEEQERWKPSLLQTLTGIEALAQKHRADQDLRTKACP